MNPFETYSKFIFRNVPNPNSRPGGSGDPDADDQNETPEQQAQREAEELRQRNVNEADENNRRQNQIAAAQVAPEIRAVMREAYASGNYERQRAVEEFLDGPKNANTLRNLKEKLDKMKEEDKSWEAIFTVQRDIRKKIIDLQYKTEDTMEIIPHRKQLFDSLLKEAKGLNKADAALDRDLKRLLAKLEKDKVISAAVAAGIYQAGANDPECEKLLKKYRVAIEGPNKERAEAFDALVIHKNHEKRIERQFESCTNQFNGLINKNLNKVRFLASKEKVLETASKAIGISIQQNVKLQYQEPANIDRTGLNKKLTIAKINFTSVNVRDRNGRVIDRILGMPLLDLEDENGSKIHKAMTIGRFKKWADSTNATEVVDSLQEVERLTGLAAYGINIEKGMDLFHAAWTRGQDGNLVRTPQYIQIKDIDTANKKIKLDKTVTYAPGYNEFQNNEERDELTFAEFVKWWHRYEVENSIGLQELQKNLQKYNEIENEEFSLDSKENQPIKVEVAEELRYPDESDERFIITKIDERIHLDTGTTYSFPEFFYWVKNNHVERVPSKKKTKTEVEADKHTREFIAEEEKYAKIKEESQKAAGIKHETNVDKDKIERGSGSIIHRIKDIWFTTQFLSLQDLWGMTKEVVEFVKRRHDRQSKGRYGEVGARLPWIGPEFERVRQSAENDEVHKNKEAMEHWDIERVKRLLHETKNKDLAKACIETLIHKGEMRWDDHEFWHTLNVLTAHYTLKGAEMFIPSPANMPKGESGESKSIEAVDALWGKGKGSEWYMESINKYNSNKNSFEYKFKQLENDPKGTGGLAFELEDMLRRWLSGKYVNAQEYEALLDGALKAGKMTAEKKMFFLISGVVAKQGNGEGKNHHGETLLHIDRVGELNSKYCPNFPILDYFTQTMVDDYSHLIDDKEHPGHKKPIKRKFNLGDYEEWVNKYFKDELYGKDEKTGKLNCKPGQGFNRFLWEVLLVSDATRIRISKGIRHAENMDHDDAHLFIPPLSPKELDNTLGNTQGQTKFFTTEGYKNGYPGYNQYVLSLSHVIEEEKDNAKKKERINSLRDALIGFVHFDSILDYRYHKEPPQDKARLDDVHYDGVAVVDDTVTVRFHQQQMRNLILAIGDAYGEDLHWLYGEKTKSMFDPVEKGKQKKHEERIDNLASRISELLERDGGVKALEVIKQKRALGEADKAGVNLNGLRGIVDSSRPASTEIKKMNEGALGELSGGGGGGH